MLIINLYVKDGLLDGQIGIVRNFEIIESKIPTI